MPENDVFLVLSTFPELVTAQRIAQQLVGQSLAACANIVPTVRSIYIWQGELQNDEEVLMLIKTTGERLAELQETLVSSHPYDVPEIIAFPVADGHHAYLQWVAAMTAGRLPPKTLDD